MKFLINLYTFLNGEFSGNTYSIFHIGRGSKIAIDHHFTSRGYGQISRYSLNLNNTFLDEQINVDCVNCEKLVRVISKKEGNLYFNDECDLNPKYDASKPAYAIIE